MDELTDYGKLLIALGAAVVAAAAIGKFMADPNPRTLRQALTSASSFA